MAKLIYRPEEIRGTNEGRVPKNTSLHACNVNGSHLKSFIQRKDLPSSAVTGFSFMQSCALKHSASSARPLFIHPLPLTYLRAVDIRELLASNSSWRRLFSTQMDYFSRYTYNSQRRVESLWAFMKQTASVVLYYAARKIVIRGLVYWRFQVPGWRFLFYKRNINPQNGGNA